MQTEDFWQLWVKQIYECHFSNIFAHLAQTVKRLPTIWETQVRSMGREDPLEKEMATHSSTLAWKIPWTEDPGSLRSMGLQELDTAERLCFTLLVLCLCHILVILIVFPIFSLFYLVWGSVIHDH